MGNQGNRASPRRLPLEAIRAIGLGPEMSSKGWRAVMIVILSKLSSSSALHVVSQLLKMSYEFFSGESLGVVRLMLLGLRNDASTTDEGCGTCALAPLSPLERALS